MRGVSVAKPRGTSGWLTTADVARILERSSWSVRWMARTGRLECETTWSGQHLFRASDVLRLNDQRAKARLRSVYVGRPKHGHMPTGPRQLSLLRPRLEVIHGGVDSSRGIVREIRGVR